MKQLINIIKTILNRLDSRILNHGERVAYLVYTILKEENKYSESEIKDATVLALLHDIGALKTDEIDSLISFDSNNTLNHCIYGYLFIKYFSPLRDKSEIVLYHHTKYSILDTYLNGYSKDISSLIFLVDRIDIFNLVNNGKTCIFLNNKGLFNDKYYNIFVALNKNNKLIDCINSYEYKERINEIDSLFNIREIKRYLEMLVYAIDFRSYQTVTHSLLVAIIATDLGKRMNLSSYKIKNLYYSALLHDVGKITTPVSILEKNGKLDTDEMQIMREHVVITKDIIKDFVSPEIMYPAIRHHERNDGSGYPNKLSKSELSIEDNIIIIADLVGALIMKRSYKESFTKEKTISILSEMVISNKIDNGIYQILMNNYDDIINSANKRIRIQEKKFSDIKNEYVYFKNDKKMLKLS